TDAQTESIKTLQASERHLQREVEAKEESLRLAAAQKDTLEEDTLRLRRGSTAAQLSARYDEQLALIQQRAAQQAADDKQVECLPVWYPLRAVSASDAYEVLHLRGELDEARRQAEELRSAASLSHAVAKELREEREGRAKEVAEAARREEEFKHVEEKWRRPIMWCNRGEEASTAPGQELTLYVLVFSQLLILSHRNESHPARSLPFVGREEALKREAAEAQHRFAREAAEAAESHMRELKHVRIATSWLSDRLVRQEGLREQVELEQKLRSSWIQAGEAEASEWQSRLDACVEERETAVAEARGHAEDAQRKMRESFDEQKCEMLQRLRAMESELTRHRGRNLHHRDLLELCEIELSSESGPAPPEESGVGRAMDPATLKRRISAWVEARVREGVDEVGEGDEGRLTLLRRLHSQLMGELAQGLEEADEAETDTSLAGGGEKMEWPWLLFGALQLRQSLRFHAQVISPPPSLTSELADTRGQGGEREGAEERLSEEVVLLREQLAAATEACEAFAERAAEAEEELSRLPNTSNPMESRDSGGGGGGAGVVDGTVVAAVMRGSLDEAEAGIEALCLQCEGQKRQLVEMKALSLQCEEQKKQLVEMEALSLQREEQKQQLVEMEALSLQCEEQKQRLIDIEALSVQFEEQRQRLVDMDALSVICEEQKQRLVDMEALSVICEEQKQRLVDMEALSLQCEDQKQQLVEIEALSHKCEEQKQQLVKMEALSLQCEEQKQRLEEMEDLSLQCEEQKQQLLAMHTAASALGAAVVGGNASEEVEAGLRRQLALDQSKLAAQEKAAAEAIREERARNLSLQRVEEQMSSLIEQLEASSSDAMDQVEALCVIAEQAASAREVAAGKVMQGSLSELEALLVLEESRIEALSLECEEQRQQLLATHTAASALGAAVGGHPSEVEAGLRRQLSLEQGKLAEQEKASAKALTSEQARNLSLQFAVEGMSARIRQLEEDASASAIARGEIEQVAKLSWVELSAHENESTEVVSRLSRELAEVRGELKRLLEQVEEASQSRQADPEEKKWNRGEESRALQAILLREIMEVSHSPVEILACAALKLACDRQAETTHKEELQRLSSALEARLQYAISGHLRLMDEAREKQRSLVEEGEALRDLVHSTTTLSERELLKASEEQQRVARKLQERLVEHESQQKLWDMAMEEANDMHEALKLQLREQEERSEIKLELVTKQSVKAQQTQMQQQLQASTAELETLRADQLLSVEQKQQLQLELDKSNARAATLEALAAELVLEHGSARREWDSTEETRAAQVRDSFGQVEQLQLDLHRVGAERLALEERLASTITNHGCTEAALCEQIVGLERDVQNSLDVGLALECVLVGELRLSEDRLTATEQARESTADLVSALHERALSERQEAISQTTKLREEFALEVSVAHAKGKAVAEEATKMLSDSKREWMLQQGIMQKRLLANAEHEQVRITILTSELGGIEKEMTSRLREAVLKADADQRQAEQEMAVLRSSSKQLELQALEQERKHQIMDSEHEHVQQLLHLLTAELETLRAEQSLSLEQRQQLQLELDKSNARAATLEALAADLVSEHESARREWDSTHETHDAQLQDSLGKVEQLQLDLHRVWAERQALEERLASTLTRHDEDEAVLHERIAGLAQGVKSSLDVGLAIQRVFASELSLSEDQFSAAVQSKDRSAAEMMSTVQLEWSTEREGHEAELAMVTMLEQTKTSSLCLAIREVEDEMDERVSRVSLDVNELKQQLAEHQEAWRHLSRSENATSDADLGGNIKMMIDELEALRTEQSKSCELAQQLQLELDRANERVFSLESLNAELVAGHESACRVQLAMHSVLASELRLSEEHVLAVELACDGDQVSEVKISVNELEALRAEQSRSCEQTQQLQLDLHTANAHVSSLESLNAELASQNESIRRFGLAVQSVLRNELHCIDEEVLCVVPALDGEQGSEIKICIDELEALRTEQSRSCEQAQQLQVDLNGANARLSSLESLNAELVSQNESTRRVGLAVQSVLKNELHFTEGQVLCVEPALDGDQSSEIKICIDELEALRTEQSRSCEQAQQLQVDLNGANARLSSLESLNAELVAEHERARRVGLAMQRVLENELRLSEDQGSELKISVNELQALRTEQSRSSEQAQQLQLDLNRAYARVSSVESLNAELVAEHENERREWDASDETRTSQLQVAFGKVEQLQLDLCRVAAEQQSLEERLASVLTTHDCDEGALHGKIAELEQAIQKALDDELAVGCVLVTELRLSEDQLSAALREKDRSAAEMLSTVQLEWAAECERLVKELATMAMQEDAQTAALRTALVEAEEDMDTRISELTMDADARFVQMQSQIVQEMADHNEAEGQMESLSSELRGLKQMVKSLSIKLEEVQAERAQLVAEHEAHGKLQEAEIQRFRQECEELEQQREASRSSQELLLERLQALQRSDHLAASERSRALSDLRSQSRRELQEALRRAKATHELLSQQQREAMAEDASVQMQEAVRSVRLELEEKHARHLSQLGEQHAAELNSARTEAGAYVEGKRRGVEKLSIQVEDLSAEVSQLTSEAECLRVELKEKELTVSRLQGELVAQMQRYEVLESGAVSASAPALYEARSEGFTEGFMKGMMQGKEEGERESSRVQAEQLFSLQRELNQQAPEGGMIQREEGGDHAMPDGQDALSILRAAIARNQHQAADTAALKCREEMGAAVHRLELELAHERDGREKERREHQEERESLIQLQAVVSSEREDRAHEREILQSEQLALQRRVRELARAASALDVSLDSGEAWFPSERVESAGSSADSHVMLVERALRNAGKECDALRSEREALRAKIQLCLAESERLRREGGAAMAASRQAAEQLRVLAEEGEGLRKAQQEAEEELGRRTEQRIREAWGRAEQLACDVRRGEEERRELEGKLTLAVATQAEVEKRMAAEREKVEENLSISLAGQRALEDRLAAERGELEEKLSAAMAKQHELEERLASERVGEAIGC
ncbi:MAG: hypothetical protein SGPRY_001308, partial [Prymnesium sp.]